MISVRRNPSPKPNAMLIARLQELSMYITQMLESNNGQSMRVLRKYKPDPIESVDPIWYEGLIKQFSGKCAYCESYIGYGEIDHFRPVDGVMDDNNDYSDHYLWLAYDWSNLYTICKYCSTHKRNFFPVEGRRANFYDNVSHESTLLIDPCIERPEEHIFFDQHGYIHPKTKKGNVTIELLNLNRYDLVYARAEALGYFKKITESLTVDLWDFPDRQASEFPYMAIVKQHLAEWIGVRLSGEERRNVLTNKKWKKFLRGVFGSYNSQKYLLSKLQPFLLREGEAEGHAIHSGEFKRRLIKKIEICNIRGISFEHSFDLDDNAASWLMLLGENGTGKTSILQSIALALLNNWYGLNVKHQSFVPKGEEGHVKVTLADDDEPIELLFLNGDVEHNNLHRPIPIIAYGAVRLIPQNRYTDNRGQGSNVRNLFIKNPNNYFLSHPSSWLKDKEKAKVVSRVILDVLPFGDSEDVSMVIDDRRAYLMRYGKRIPLQNLSSGYQTIIALTIDIMRSIYSEFKNGDLAEGIVLIDEIDAHLHPSWKMRIVNQMRKAFPRLQFIVTSHDPLCLRGIKQGEVAVIQRAQLEAEVLTDLPDPMSLRIDQILTSEFFGLNSTVDPEIDDMIQQYHLLLNNESILSEKEAKELERIQKRLAEPDLKYLGYNNRERKLYKVIDSYIARKKVNNESYFELDEESQEEILSIWDEMEGDL